MTQEFFPMIQLSESDVPVFGYPIFDRRDTVYTDQSTSFWANPNEANEDQGNIIIAKVLRINKKQGTMKVIGVDHDIYADVPIPSSMISSEQMGDVSQPASDASVILARTSNGDYVPLNYLRMYSDENSFGTGVPDELEEGDMGWKTRGGGKLYMFENGMIQIESSPNCSRFYFPLDDGEQIQDVCREYNMVTDNGTIQMSRRGITDFSRFSIEVPENSGSSPVPMATLEMGALDDLNTETGFQFKVYKSNVGGVKIDAGHLKIQKTGKIDLNAQLDLELSAVANVNINGTKINLGGATAIEPIPLGLKLQAEIEAIKIWMMAHLHPVVITPSGPTTTPPTIPLTTPGGYLSSQSFVK